MALLEINRHPTAGELRWFGVLLALFVGLAGGLAYWRFEAPAAARMVWTAGGALAAIYAAAPPLKADRSRGIGGQKSRAQRSSRRRCGEGGGAVELERGAGVVVKLDG